MNPPAAPDPADAADFDEDADTVLEPTPLAPPEPRLDERLAESRPETVPPPVRYRRGGGRGRRRLA